MRKFLIVVDMQKDFVDGALGTQEACQIVPKVAEKVKNFDGKVIFTMDTHSKKYLKSQEGRNLPVEHCIEGTEGHAIVPELQPFVKKSYAVFKKDTFGSRKLAKFLRKLNKKKPIESIELAGLCTDICVISNALLLKAFLPEVPIIVDSSCCAGVTPESHDNALCAMRGCQILV